MNGGVLGVILAGGAGQRVGGADKGLLTVHDTPVAGLVAAVLQPQCDRVVIVANRNQHAYGRIARVISDETPGHRGPLAGIVAALALAIESGDPDMVDVRWLLTVPVDCPDFPADLGARLRAKIDPASGMHCVYARDEHKVQPLFALYSLHNHAELLRSARDAVHVHASPLRWHMQLGAHSVDFSEQTAAFRNLNAIRDFREYELAHPQAVKASPAEGAAPTTQVDDATPIAQPGPAHPMRIDVEAALQLIAARSAQHLMPSETVPLSDAAGRVLADSVHAPHALPPFANSAMDGYAVRGADLPSAGTREFKLVGEVLAGATLAPPVGAGECVRITTGAPLPEGADSVVMKENTSVAGEAVSVAAGEAAGANVRAAGEDYAEGDVAFDAGTPIGPAQLAVLAAFGIASVSVRRRVRVAILATGDELVAPGAALGFGQIHESNATMLAAMARECGMHVCMQACVRDEPGALRAALLEAAADADLIVSSGGVSVGEADHLPRVLAQIGEVHFHKVRVKPGMPMLFGQFGASLYFGLPGNPVSAAVTFRVFVQSALRSMLGAASAKKPGRARLALPVHKRHDRAEFVRCRLHVDDEGVQWATPHARQGSGMLRGLAESDALAFLPEGPRDYAEGEAVTLWP